MFERSQPRVFIERSRWMSAPVRPPSKKAEDEAWCVLLFYSDTVINVLTRELSCLKFWRQSVAFGQLVDWQIWLCDSCYYDWLAHMTTNAQHTRSFSRKKTSLPISSMFLIAALYMAQNICARSCLWCWILMWITVCISRQWLKKDILHFWCLYRRLKKSVARTHRMSLCLGVSLPMFSTHSCCYMRYKLVFFLFVYLFLENFVLPSNFIVQRCTRGPKHRMRIILNLFMLWSQSYLVEDFLQQLSVKSSMPSTEWHHLSKYETQWALLCLLMPLAPPIFCPLQSLWCQWAQVAI